MKKVILYDNVDNEPYAIFEIEPEELKKAIEYRNKCLEEGNDYTYDFEMITDYLYEHKIPYSYELISEMESIYY